MDDPATIALLEQAALGDDPRQALYALSVLTAAKRYRFPRLLPKLAVSRQPEIRARAYELAAESRDESLVDNAHADVRLAGPASDPGLVLAATKYVLEMAPETRPVAALLLNYPNPMVVEGALDFLVKRPELARDLITHDWLTEVATNEDPKRRRLAAFAVRARGDQGTEVLHKLFADDDPAVVTAACQCAAALQNREYVGPMILRLEDPKLRGIAIESLASFGTKITGTLGDLLADESVPQALRRQIPRVLRLIPVQRSVDVLLQFINHPDLAVRSATLRALNRLRETAPDLNYGDASIREQVLTEARYYFELLAALEAFREQGRPHTPAGLLVATLEECLKRTLERLFRLLGLRYPPRQIYAAYLAVSRGGSEQALAALEFLDAVLERDLKRIIVPILDDPSMQSQSGRDLFGVQVKTTEGAIRELLGSGDEWLSACAIATAAQLGLTVLAPEINTFSASKQGEVSQVARDAMAVLA